MHKKKKVFYVCRCFSIPEADIDKAMAAGCTTLHQILDFTGAGSGPCGGTCRVKINALLEKYLEKKNNHQINADIASEGQSTKENDPPKNGSENSET